MLTQTHSLAPSNNSNKPITLGELIADCEQKLASVQASRIARQAKKHLSNKEEVPSLSQTPAKRKRSNDECQTTLTKCKRQKLVTCSFKKQEEEKTKSFFKEIIKALGIDNCRNLCLEALRGRKSKDNIKNGEMKKRLWKRQQEKIAFYLGAPHLITAFYGNARPIINSITFVARQQWLSDMNIILMFYRMIGEHCTLERKTAACALEAIKDKNFNIAPFAKEIRESFRLDNCEVLDLCSAQLSEIPNWLVRFPLLKKLKLNENKLTNLPDISFNPFLEKINLRGNQIDPKWKFPLSLNNTSVKVIDLRKNNLKSVPRFLRQLQGLSNLSLANNHIERVPKQITKLKNLQKLDFSNNKLTELPLNLIELRELRVLDISNNPLSSIPSNLPEKKRLEIHISPDQEDLFSANLKSKFNIIIKSSENSDEDSLEVCTQSSDSRSTEEGSDSVSEEIPTKLSDSISIEKPPKDSTAIYSFFSEEDVLDSWDSTEAAENLNFYGSPIKIINSHIEL